MRRSSRRGTGSARSAGSTGQLYGAIVGIDAAHVRWFALDGPDDPDNGLALCVLHHKLFDRGVLGVDLDLRIHVSTIYTARTSAGRALYNLHGVALEARQLSICDGIAVGCSRGDRWPPDVLRCCLNAVCGGRSHQPPSVSSTRSRQAFLTQDGCQAPPVVLNIGHVDHCWAEVAAERGPDVELVVGAMNDEQDRFWVTP
ncbi:MAG TPA: HNH endonuclease [Actinoplanes sp.]|nr:HNH endonuclease [Actinoplanes sp.]